ncbi:zinc-dependent metalloprotease [Uliginosibacterium paludis]|uniref:Zinc-dependent metalloprotease n=1 Tax=Uliginosibacterium paludis TaxID=1615952 RepID=A0ABV2CM01_9RHOO
MRNERSGLHLLTTGVVLSLVLSACAHAPGKAPSSPRALSAAPSAAASAPAATAARGASASASSQASNLRPYAEVIKDFKRVPGYLNVYQKDERWLLELHEEDFKRDFFFTAQRSQGIGEKWFLSGLMLDAGVGYFQRLSDRVQWIERNTRHKAPGNEAMSSAVASAFSDSLRGSAPILSQPEPQSRAILVDLNALLLTDFSATASALQSMYRQPYQFDRGNSLIQNVSATAEATRFELRQHYAAAALASGVPGQPVQPSQPETLVDARSMFMGISLRFAKLPEAMPGRPADHRVGYFTTEHYDFSRETATSPRSFVINHWRLEKKDPAASVSEPVRAIVYELDRSIPARYRETVRQGILAWNRAFEGAGFKDAIRVQDAPEDGKPRSGPMPQATVGWVLGTDANASVGYSYTDPRSGEILAARIVLSDQHQRNARRSVAFQDAQHAEEDEDCDFAARSFAQLHQALLSAEAQGALTPDGPEAEALAQDMMRWVVMHEVGHTLGLRHNFRASTAYTLAQLRDPAFVEQHGLSSSVMDYLPLNRWPGKPARRPAMTQKMLGAYDLWAIAYGYTPFPAESERLSLKQIAERAFDNPLLAYGEDSDAGSGWQGSGVDPAVARQDLGQDPVAWLRHTLDLSRELWQGLARRPASERDQEDSETRIAVAESFRLIGDAANAAARNIGGIRVNRATSATRRDVFVPVPAATQRATLAALSEGLFQPDSFRLDPALLRRLAPSPFDRTSLAPQPSILNNGLAVQSNLLDLLFSNRLSQRLLDSETLGGEAYRLTELHRSLRRDIWAELDTGRDIPLPRRMLQRAWLTRLSGQILAGKDTPADARSVFRAEARSLQASLRRAVSQGSRSPEARAHLQDALDTLNETLNAPLLRQTP